jgi:hypothetical protein
VESTAHGDGEAREGLFVSVLRPSDQLGIHVCFHRNRTRSSRALKRYGEAQRPNDSIFAAGAAGGSA